MSFVKCLFSGCLIFVSLHLVLSAVCPNNKLCRPGLLTSSITTLSSYVSTNRMPFTLLNSSALQKTSAKNEQHCLQKCYALSTCLSINVLSNISENIEIECQLLGEQAYTNKEKLVFQANSTHYTILNAGCEKGLCLNNSTCIPNYNDDSSTCKCVSTNFDGTFCEREIKVVLLRYNRGYGYGPQVQGFMKETSFKQPPANSLCLLTFNDAGNINSNRGGQAFAYFIPPETGIYYFIIACNYYCSLFISTVGKQDRRVYLSAPGCLMFVLLHLVLSAVCPTNKLCRPGLLTSSITTLSSYISTNRMLFTLLNSSALQKTSAKNEQHCLQKCYALSTCLSINVLSNISSSIEIECQLLGEQAYTNKDKLVYQANSTHYTVLNTGCEKGLCLNNSTCIPNYNDDTSSCKCVSTNFDGNFCEREIKVVLLRYNRGYNYGPSVQHFMQETTFKNKPSLPSSSCLLTFNDGSSINNNMGGQVFAYFVPPETGIYYFTIKCTYNCNLYISTVGKQDRRIYIKDPGKGPAIYMKENNVKFLEMLIAIRQNDGNGYTTSFSLGVTFPNGTVSDPVDNRYLASRF
ncbi:uncharacterized protein LOC105843513 isoform X2 [Hydra vulgaris]|uniref:uncharacterized protein LOC105843513 isoform X2 n=1 Tax=Hydra vulgaris TaxID=6087 RepID=UPI0032EA1886